MIVEVPGSKSIANRALLLAALADGSSTVRGLPDGDDTTAMRAGLAGLGVVVDGDDHTVVVAGSAGHLRPQAELLQAGLAGTTSRFLVAAATLADRPLLVDGDAPLRTRPMAPLFDALRALGAELAAGEADGHLPVTVSGPPAGGTVAMRGDVSSQFLSAVMMIAPLLPGGVRLELTSALISRPYVELTAAVMAAFGATDVMIDDDAIVVGPGRYVGLDYTVEPDASTASYPLAVAALSARPLVVAGLGDDSLQGDRRILDLLVAMGCRRITTGSGDGIDRHPAAPLVGIDVDLADCSDLVPTIAVVAAVATTPTTIRGVGFIRAKESDRLGALATELTKLGASVADTADGLMIEPVGGAAALHGGRLATHHDHRLAMAFGVLGAVVPGITVDDPTVVSKSWPSFWRALEALTAPAG